jgi:hypothetical protein
MTTENSNQETENEVPPVARIWRLAVSEWVVYSFVGITAIAVIVGFVVGGERDTQADRAMNTLLALTEEVESRVSAGSQLVCDNRLLDPEFLANDYLTLSISQAPINENDKSLGYGPALYVSVVEEEVSGDTWNTAKRLMDLVKEVGKEEGEKDKNHRDVASNTQTDEEDADNIDKKPKNALREVRKTGFGEDDEYLRYYILASEVAICS